MTPTPVKVLHVAGARPNFMKVAPVMRAFAAKGGDFVQRLVHTGQHYDDGMSKVFFDELALPAPDINLGVGSGSHAAQTAQIMMRFEPVILEFAPNWLLVYGDVNSTVACTLVAAKCGVPVAHVEAGLRSFDRTMPEEVNRVVTDALAELLLTPSPDADENLLREGIAAERIRRVGNVMIDTLCHSLERARVRDVVRRLGLSAGGYVYVTLHRPSNVDERGSLERIVDSLAGVAERMPVVFPAHPRTRQRLADFELIDRLGAASGVRLLEPLGYLDSLCLTEQAACVLTDSGGLQEETTYLGVPCLTLRPNTERPITLTSGSNRLTTLDALDADVQAAVRRRESGEGFQQPDLWDGHAAERIVETMSEMAT
jgi:UDP-N-acetylglucosamine 2-epimerase (non-hydrolysing)